MLAPGSDLLHGTSEIAEFWRAGIAARIRGAELQTLSVEKHDGLAIEVGRYALLIEPPGETGRDGYRQIRRRAPQRRLRLAAGHRHLQLRHACRQLNGAAERVYAPPPHDMNDPIIPRGPLEGRTLLVDGSDYATYKVRSAETERAYFCFEVSATPRFGPPPHAHAYRELYYVLDGRSEFTPIEDGNRRTIVGTLGTATAVEPDVPPTFRNVSDLQARLLITHGPAVLGEFFEDFGVAVERAGETTDHLAPPEFGAMAAALERHGVRVLAEQRALR